MYVPINYVFYKYIVYSAKTPITYQKTSKIPNI